jgi:hypothetical protein
MHQLHKQLVPRQVMHLKHALLTHRMPACTALTFTAAQQFERAPWWLLTQFYKVPILATCTHQCFLAVHKAVE